MNLANPTIKEVYTFLEELGIDIDKLDSLRLLCVVVEAYRILVRD